MVTPAQPIQYDKQPEADMVQSAPLLSMDFLNQLAAQLIELAATPNTVQLLREQFPEIRFLLCSDDDMAEREPFLSFDAFGFYLMSGGLGCACLTNDMDKAVGVIIATIEE
ncbi:hypothetical protein K0504_10655 [Neiella marina]|uniref:DUF6129 domain-containing protein n=1 Tax=Neiella holothuriorum TaxID=2870530 RepID=A0ABS7EIM6_9GAMM|nr:DUF6129 family protein [Neiella holothuriorum]MBW8191497.1 hypothetical protein [Neiella holothuriorum]